MKNKTLIAILLALVAIILILLSVRQAKAEKATPEPKQIVILYLQEWSYWVRATNSSTRINAGAYVDNSISSPGAPVFTNAAITYSNNNNDLVWATPPTPAGEAMGVLCVAGFRLTSTDGAMFRFEKP